MGSGVVSAYCTVCGRGFGPCTTCTGLHVICYHLPEAQPIEFLVDEIQCSCLAKVACAWVIMVVVVVNDLQPEGSMIQNVKSAPEPEGSICPFPSFWVGRAVQVLAHSNSKWIGF